MDLVQESVGVVGVLAEDKKQTITVSGDREISVSADRSFLRMAVINLVDNAVKYSPPDSAIRLSLNGVKAASNQPATEAVIVELSIKDEGAGIPADQIERVFDRFYRVDEGRTRDAGGAGLGLAIAKLAVETHGGEISLTSQQPGGSIFTIRLPLA
jgi:two-component system, OmpR family, sensor histidine kinase SenX3